MTNKIELAKSKDLGFMMSVEFPVETLWPCGESECYRQAYGHIRLQLGSDEYLMPICKYHLEKIGGKRD